MRQNLDHFEAPTRKDAPLVLLTLSFSITYIEFYCGVVKLCLLLPSYYL
jgi:hypothetical protein